MPSEFGVFIRELGVAGPFDLPFLAVLGPFAEPLEGPLQIIEGKDILRTVEFRALVIPQTAQAGIQNVLHAGPGLFLPVRGPSRWALLPGDGDADPPDETSRRNAVLIRLILNFQFLMRGHGGP